MTNATNKLWTLTTLLLLGMFCTIRDDNGNPAAPGSDQPVEQPVDETLTPSLFATPDSAYVMPGDTLGVRVRALGTSSVTDSVVPLISLSIRAQSNIGTIIDDTILTDRDGRGRFLFTSSEPGNVEFIVAGSGVQQTVRFQVTETPIPTQKLLQAMPGASIIKADGHDSTVISVAVLNTYRNPIIGECVQFISTAGTIIGNSTGCKNSGQSQTGSDGIARATLVSSNINDTAFITTYLVADQSLSDEVEVAFQGMTIQLAASKNNMKRGDTTVVTARVINASGQAVARSPVFFSLGRGAQSNLTIIAVDTFTNYDGIATARLVASTTGTDALQVAAAGADASIQMNVSELYIELELDKTNLQTSATDTAHITVFFANASSTPLSSRTVKLTRYFKKSTNADTTDILTATTNSAGKCSFAVAALSWEGTMRLSATGFDNSEGYASADTMLQFITTRVMSIRAPQPILADGVSRGPVMVFVKNKSGNPIVGDNIIFTTTAGTIATTSKTNQEGKAEAMLISDRRNVAALVTATLESDPEMTQSTTVQFKGVELTAAVYPPSIRSNGADSATVLLALLDAAKIPIMGERFNVSKQQGATTITVIDTITNNDGEAYCKISGTGTGRDTLQLSAAGATAVAIINYSSNILVIDTAAGQTCIADSTDSTRINITYYRGDRTTTIPNTPIDISATVGQMDTIFARTLTTDANGRITFYLRNPHFAVTTTLFGLARSETEITTGVFNLYFKANVVKKIDLSGSPEVITTDGGRAKIEAVAFDALGNRVKDAKISFNLVSGPSGGERIDPPVALTGDDGKATTYLVSGKTPSNFRQVSITAGSFSSVKSDTVFFTIAGPPKSINVGYNIEKGNNPNDGTFMLPCAAIVTDINGNPVADGTEVTFSLKVSGVTTLRLVPLWDWDLTNRKCIYITDTAYTVLPFEDLNDNFHLDPGEDFNGDSILNRGEDVNGDGKINYGPPFEDINSDGVRQYNWSHTPEEWHQCSDSVFEYTDFNHNFRWDPIEPLLDPEYLSAYNRLLIDKVFTSGDTLSAENIADMATLQRLDDQYTARADALGGRFDIDAIHNGVLDPNTAVSITRTVQTKDGKALNSILYSQSDANRIQVKLWAEAQGVVTVSPATLVLPVIGGGGN